jgi:hypothetical protein
MGSGIIGRHHPAIESRSMHSSPRNGDHLCSMPHCGRPSCFHVRLEAAGADRDGGLDSCGAHLAEVVQKLALPVREQRERPARVVVYAAGDGQENAPGPFDRIVLGAIPV